jgi:PHP domain-containing protein/carbohydrate binding protein with CBM11 domain
LRVFFWRPFEIVRAALPDRQARASGVVHVHTSFSDGSRKAEDVIRAAQAAGLDYVIITDHNAFEAKPLEGYAGRLLVMVGTEISTRSGHILAFGLREPRFRFSDDALEVLEDIRDLGGVAVAAHPDSRRKELRWTGWDLPGPWGLELLNGDSQWREANWLERIRGISTYALNSDYALLRLLGPPGGTVERWNRMLAIRSVPMLVGADAHGFPSYEAMFKWGRNHVLLERPPSGDAMTDGRAIASSLQRGRGYVALDALAPADGFFFVAEQGDTQWTMGDEVGVVPPPRLRAGGSLPSGARVSLIRDAHVVAEGVGQVDLPAAPAGVYRVEVRLPDWDLPWIVSNAIYVFDAPTLATRRQRSVVPAPPPPSALTRVLDTFDGSTAFVVARDGSTVVKRDIIEARAGADQSNAARLEFTLGAPAAATPSPFAALALTRREDFSAAHGLAFSIKGDDVYRIWVQVRDDNPRSEDGTEWWYASVKTSRDWRRVALPFERLRTRDPGSDGRLDLSKVTGVYFIVDTGVAKPGTSGVIWLDDVGVY